jgi:hypothetical protein
VAAQVAAQDVAPDEAGHPHLRRGVARDRSINVEDGQMRHGRKTARPLVDGYKRHVGRDLGSGLAWRTWTALAADLACQPVLLVELHIARMPSDRRVAILLALMRRVAMRLLSRAATRGSTCPWCCLR